MCRDQNGEWINHDYYEVDLFFKSIGITRNEFIKKSNYGNSIFPSFRIEDSKEIITYLQNLSVSKEPNYEIY